MTGSKNQVAFCVVAEIQNSNLLFLEQLLLTSVIQILVVKMKIALIKKTAALTVRASRDLY